MIIKDITDSYIELIIEENNLKKYEESFPKLFEHYFTFWAQKDYWHKELDKKQVLKRKSLVLDRLLIIEKKLSEHGFDTKNLQVVLIVGQ